MPTLKSTLIFSLLLTTGLVSAQSSGSIQYRAYLSGLKITAPSPNASLSSTSVDFGQVAEGDSVQRTITFTVEGGGSVSNARAQLTGSNLSLISSTCGATGAPVTVTGSCSVTVSYSPSSVGALGPASITVLSSASNGPQTATFSGTAISAARILSLSPAVAGKSSWDLDVDGPLSITSAGVYTITPSRTLSITSKLWGAGGGAGDPYPGQSGATLGGGGGAVSGTLTIQGGQQYTVIVGSPGSKPNAGSFGFGGNGSFGGTGYVGGGGGGLTGLFTGTNITSDKQALAILVAAGGGGGGSSAFNGYNACIATAGGAMPFNITNPYGAASPVFVQAPTLALNGMGASGMRGGNASTTITWDGRGGGGGGYKGGGAYNISDTNGCLAGTGGLNYVAASVSNSGSFDGGKSITGSAYAFPGNRTDLDYRVPAGQSGSPGRAVIR